MTHATFRGSLAVVLVDDEREILASFRRLTRNEPYPVRTTTSPRQALEWVERGETCLVISDQRMPEMAGTELLERVERSSPSTVRILLTGYPESTFLPSAAPRPLIIYKPWDDEELRLEIRRILETVARHEP